MHIFALLLNPQRETFTIASAAMVTFLQKFLDPDPDPDYHKFELLVPGLSNHCV